jgi:transcription antitermination factor NusG
MLKLDQNPPILWPTDAFEDHAQGLWWVAHTRSRQEKALAWFLHENELPYFLPLQPKAYLRKGRRRQSLLPLFPGYLFFRADELARHTALTSNRIAHVIEVFDQLEINRQLARIHRAVISGQRLDPHPHLRTGASVRVTAGSLKGIEGVIVHKRGVCKLVLNVDILGQAAAVEIDADFVEPIASFPPTPNTAPQSAET